MYGRPPEHTSDNACAEIKEAHADKISTRTEEDQFLFLFFYQLSRNPASDHGAAEKIATEDCCFQA